MNNNSKKLSNMNHDCSTQPFVVAVHADWDFPIITNHIHNEDNQNFKELDRITLQFKSIIKEWFISPNDASPQDVQSVEFKLEEKRKGTVDIILNLTNKTLSSQSSSSCDGNHSNNQHHPINEYGNHHTRLIDKVASFDTAQSILNKIYAETYHILELESMTLFVDVNVVLEHYCGYDIFKTNTYHKIYRLYLSSQDANLNALSHQIESSENTIVVSSFPQSKGASTRYKHVAVGGTFDHLHIGHKILLCMTAWLSEQKVTCGVFGFNDTNIQSKKAYKWMQPLQSRIQKVKAFLFKWNCRLQYHVEEINDPFGPTKDDPSIEALVGSYETKIGCEMVNEERMKLGLSPLHLYYIKVLSISRTDSDLTSSNSDEFVLKISSSKIRQALKDIEEN